MNEKNERMIFDVTYQPQVRTVRDTQRIMLDVIIATLPIVGFGVYRFGWHALLLVVSSMAAAVFFEWAYRRILKKSITIDDLSAAVTGLLLVMVLPPQTPVWMAVIGDFFAIVIVKQLYGGIGKNFLNPALAGRAFLTASYSGVLTIVVIDGVTSATPLGYLYGCGRQPAGRNESQGIGCGRDEGTLSGTGLYTGDRIWNVRSLRGAFMERGDDSGRVRFRFHDRGGRRRTGTLWGRYCHI